MIPKMTTAATIAATTTMPIHDPRVSRGSSAVIFGTGGYSSVAWDAVAFVSVTLVIRAPSVLIIF
jgi:hypothetical protein